MTERSQSESGDLASDALEYVISEQWGLNLLTNPLGYVKQVLKDLRAGVPMALPRISLTLMPAAAPVKAISRSARRWFRSRPEYRIELSRNLLSLLHDVAELYGTRMVIVSRQGQLLETVETSAGQVADTLGKKIVGHFHSERRWPATKFDHIRAERIGREMRMPDSQRRGGTIHLLLQQMALFIIAHEVGHVMLGHCDRTELPEDAAGRMEEEGEADAWAAFAVFSVFDGWVKRSAMGAEQLSYGTVAILTAVALLFGVHEAIAKAAAMLNRPWDPNYPSAMERYERFKIGCITEVGVPANAFTDRVSHLTAPDPYATWFPTIADQIDWRKVEQNFLADPQLSTLEFYTELFRGLESNRADEYAVPLILRGSVCERQQRYTEAESLFKRALAIQERNYGSHHPELVFTLSRLADCYASLKRNENAEAVATRAALIIAESSDSDLRDYDTAITSLAQFYEGQRRFEQAESLYRRVLGVQRVTRVDGAEPLYRRVLRVKKGTNGLNSPQMASTLSSLGWVSKERSYFEEAESFYKDALTLLERHHGAGHPATETALNDLAVLYNQQQRYDDAEPLIEKVVTIWKNEKGNEHPESLRALGALAFLYLNQGRHEEAERLYQQVLATEEKVFGACDINTAHTLHNLGGVYVGQDRFIEAESLLRRALAIEEAAGECNPLLEATLITLATVFENRERLDEAESCLLRTLRLQEECHGPEALPTAKTVVRLREFYRTRGRVEEWKQMNKRLATILDPFASHSNS
jgi:tetratricopeptide (TPR) repeat protein